MPSLDQLPEYCPGSPAQWRQWLKRNHAKAPGVWLVYYKKHSGKQGLSYSEAVDEALCWGWIDSKMQPLDEERYRQVFTPRKPRSVWSALNKRKIAAMEAAGRMQAPGRAKINAAKADGSWETLDAVEALEIPEELRIPLEANSKARSYYETLTPGRRKMLLSWLHNAKRPATRATRVSAIVEALAGGRMPVG